MKSDAVEGLLVRSQADGKPLGRIATPCLSRDGTRISGFLVDGTGFHGAECAMLWLDSAAVRTIGHGSVVVDAEASLSPRSAGVAGSRSYAESWVVGRSVVDADGRYLGRAVSVEFEPTTYRLTHVEVSPGLYRGNHLLPMAWIGEIRHEAVVVKRQGHLARHGGPEAGRDPEWGGSR